MAPILLPRGAASTEDAMTRHHPRALYLLALVQLWARFACFATLPLLVLYLQQIHGLRPDGALMLCGTLQALSYLSGLPGGLLADRWIGRRLATMLGTTLLTLGYGALALERPQLLGPAILLLIAGHGFFKPALHALVGSLYRDGDPRRDSGFLLLHCIFNAGAAVAPLVAEWARARWGWAAVFQVAALGMLASTTCFAASATALRTAHPAAVLPDARGSASSEASERVRACRQICSLGVVFWIAAAQATTSLTLFAEQHTVLHLSLLGRALHVAPGHFMSLHSLLVLALAPPLGWLLSSLCRRGAALSTADKMAWDFVATGAAFAVMTLAGLQGGDTARVGLGWLGCCYVLLTLGELLLAPMGLALVTRLSPPQKTSRLVALWFVATAAGNELAGLLGFLWTRWPHHRYFGGLALLSLGAAAILTRLGAFEVLLAGSRREANATACDERIGDPAVPESSELSAALSTLPAFPERMRRLLAALAIAAPVPLTACSRLPLPVRAFSAIGGGLAVLLCGSFLIVQTMDGLPSQARERAA
ncbi:MAG: MFS transporter [Polyangia bacterium]